LAALRAAGATVAVGIFLSVLCGCDTETASGTTTTPAPSHSGSAPATRPATQPATGTGTDTAPDHGLPLAIPDGYVRVTGMVFSASGPGAVPDRPFERGGVVAIPHERFMAIQKLSKPGLVVGKYMQKSLALSRKLLEEDGVGFGDLGEDGTYRLALRPGRYAFCLVELGGKRPVGTPDGKFWIERWIEVTVTDSELQTVLPVYNRATGEITVLH
jgi:hypothetical protein